jgi:hypothetical protein
LQSITFIYKGILMKKLIVSNLITLAMAVLLLGSFNTTPRAAAQSDSRAQDYYTLVRQYNKQVHDGIQGLKVLQSEWNANGYGSSLPAGSGANSGISRSQLGAVVFDTTDALKAVLDANGAAHTGNMAKLF